jgi:hypothetical protein
MPNRFARATALAVLATAVIALALAAGPVFAAEDAPQVEVQFLVDGEQGNGFLLVNGVLPEDVSLPATLTLPVPDGASIWWAGELSGTGAESDIEREYVVADGEGGLTVSFSLETTHTGQYDALYLPTSVLQDERTAILQWVQSSPASRLLFSVRLPPGADDASIDPMPASGPATNRIGESLYILPDVPEPEVGEVFEVEATYRSGSLLDTGSQGPDVVVVLAVLAAFLVIVVILIVRAQSRARVVAGPDDEPVADPTADALEPDSSDGDSTP